MPKDIVLDALKVLVGKESTLTSICLFLASAVSLKVGILFLCRCKKPSNSHTLQTRKGNLQFSFFKRFSSYLLQGRS